MGCRLRRGLADQPVHVRQLAHQEANAVRRAYTHSAEYWPERVLMMQAWADYLDELREGGKVKVLPLKKASVG
jgi:integrase